MTKKIEEYFGIFAVNMNLYGTALKTYVTLSTVSGISPGDLWTIQIMGIKKNGCILGDKTHIVYLVEVGRICVVGNQDEIHSEYTSLFSAGY